MDFSTISESCYNYQLPFLDELPDLVKLSGTETQARDIKEVCNKVSEKMRVFNEDTSRIESKAFYAVKKAMGVLVSKMNQSSPFLQSEKVKNIFLLLEQNIFMCFLTKIDLKPTAEELECFSSLIKTFAPSTCIRGNNYLITYLAASGSPEIRALALQCIPNAPAEARRQALVRAVERQDSELITALMQSGVTPNDVMEELLSRRKIRGISVLAEPLPFFDHWNAKVDDQPIWFFLLKFSYIDSKSIEDEDFRQKQGAERISILKKLTNEQLNTPYKGDLLFDLAIRAFDDVSICYLIERGVTPTDKCDLLNYIAHALCDRIDSIPLKHFQVWIDHQLVSPHVLSNIRRNREMYSYLKTAWGITSESEAHILQMEKLKSSYVESCCFNLKEHSNKLSQLLEILKTFSPCDTIMDYYQQHIALLQNEFKSRQDAVQELMETNEISLIRDRVFNSGFSIAESLLRLDVQANLIRMFSDENIQYIYSHMNRTLYNVNKSIAHFLLDKTLSLTPSLGYQGLGLDGHNFRIQLDFIIPKIHRALARLENTLDKDSFDILKNIEKALTLCAVTTTSMAPIDPCGFSFDYPYLLEAGVVEHAVVLCIEKGSENETMRLSILNTGDGLGEHTRLLRTNKYQTVMSFDNIPKTQALNLDHIRKMMQIKRENTDMSDLYHLFNKWCQGGEKVIFGDEYFEQVQLNGSCTAQSIMAFIRYYILKNASGTSQDRLGLYKFLKAQILLGIKEEKQVGDSLRPFVSSKLEKLIEDLKLFENVAYKPIQAYLAQHSTVESNFGRFTILRGLVKQLRFDNSPIPEGLESITQIIESRRSEQQANEEFLYSRLTSFLKDDKARVFLNENWRESKIVQAIYSIFPNASYRSLVLKWYEANRNELPDLIRCKLEENVSSFIEIYGGQSVQTS